MDVGYINPFISATVDTYRMMLGCDLTVGKPIVKKDTIYSHEVTGVIGLTGKAQGIVAVSFPKEVALQTVSQMLAIELTEIDADVADGIGEIANIVSGYAKQGLMEYALNISLPNVVLGTDNRITAVKGVPIFSIPFSGSLGDFVMEISLNTSI